MSAPANLRRLPSGRDDWRTPPELFYAIQKTLMIPPFTLDAAASAEDSLCPEYLSGPCFAPELTCHCGLCARWCGIVFCNPPFSMVNSFVHKAAGERTDSVLIVPNATDARWWQHAYAYAHVVLHLKGRVPFIDPTTEQRVSGNTTGTTLFYFNDRWTTREEGCWDWKADL